MKVLDVHDGTENNLTANFPDAEIEHVSILDIEAWPKENKYDIVFCFHSLPLIQAGKVPDTVQIMADLLAPGGELWASTPSLEWCSRHILSTNPQPYAHTLIYGHSEKQYKSGYTVFWLRGLMESAGLVIRQAKHDTYYLSASDGQQLKALQNIVIGWNYEPLVNNHPAT